MTQENEVIHYGIKGMKWGNRRNTNSNGLVEKGTTRVRLSEDSLKSLASETTARQYGVKALSNDELRLLNDRLNLEANYSRLTSPGTPENRATDRGAQVYKGMKKAVDISNEVYKAYNSPAVKLVREQIKAARG